MSPSKYSPLEATTFFQQYSQFGKHSFYSISGITNSWFAAFFFISSTSSNLLSFREFFNLENSQKSQGARSEVNGGWCNWTILCLWRPILAWSWLASPKEVKCREGARRITGFVERPEWITYALIVYNTYIFKTQVTYKTLRSNCVLYRNHNKFGVDDTVVVVVVHGVTEAVQQSESESMIYADSTAVGVGVR